MINLSLPNLSKEEIKASSSTIRDGWVAGGKFIKKFEDEIKNFTKAKHAISCINGTSALHLALRAIGASKDNEILMPSVSFIATANATIYNNSSPIFLDVDKYLNLDCISLENFIKKQTFKKKGILYNKKSKKKILAVVVVHVFGTAAKTRVLIESTDGKDRWYTVGVNENIIEASLQALLDSIEYRLLKK